ncbi:MAG TPA: nucleotide pyrophosphohydrolase [Candidatus Babeliales bacterium]|jgi:NTP pyrophosphatase (non-canonical NTP hydrolase)|nr:nucleotide pyrophosphohydrolase [Candidatus Babeliales bacterium]
MNDHSTTINQLKQLVDDFIDQRDWHQFHSPKNLSMNIAAEAAELMEHFLWCSTQEASAIVNKQRSDIQDELADILMAVCTFANATGIDLSSALVHKLEKHKIKYPIEKCKGKSDKYTTYT